MKSDDNGKLIATEENPMPVFVAGSGSAKSISAEAMNEHYHDKRKAIVICFTDVKKLFEFAHAIFPPTEDWHLRQLRQFGRKVQPKKMVIWHPFTFAIEDKDKKIKEAEPYFNIKKHPELKFFTISIKDLTRTELELLTQSHSETKEMQIMLDILPTLKDDEGLFEFVRLIDKRLKSESEKSSSRVIKPSGVFHTTTALAGDRKDIGQIQSNIKPFTFDYFIAPANGKYNFKPKEIFNQQDKYHFISTRFISDEKIDKFVTLCVMNNIIKNLGASNHLVIFYCPELALLCPATAYGFSQILADYISRTLITVRNKKGMVVGDTQNPDLVNQGLMGSFNEKFYGRFGDDKIINSLSKSLRLNADMVTRLTNLDKGEFFRQADMKDLEETYKFLLPAHGHKEPYQSFYKMYFHYNKKEPQNYPLVDYVPLIKEMREILEKEDKESDRRAMEEYHRKLKEEQKYFESKKSKDDLQTKEKLNQQQKKEIFAEKYKEVSKEIYEIVSQSIRNQIKVPEDLSWAEIGRRVGVANATRVRKRYEEYKQRVENPDIQQKNN